MDNNAQPTAKQQVIEALRSAESVVITTSKNPSRDEVAAAIGLHLLLAKLDKVAEVVITAPVPKQLSFLPSEFINQEIQGQRDFVIEVDQSRTETDHIKYVKDEDDNKLKFYVTPYNGVYSADDVSFSYGDYHCDVIIGLGVSDRNQIDPAITQEQKLIQDAQFMFISSEGGQGGPTSWSDASASSVCEMVMSMSEALGSGMMDREIATALFTGIVDKTEHFTNATTSPKVMTMAAQLLAAGANQAEVVKQLSVQPEPPAAMPEAPSITPNTDTSQKSNQSPAPAEEKPQEPAKGAGNEFQIRNSKDEGVRNESPDLNVRSEKSSDEVAVGSDGQINPEPAAKQKIEEAPTPTPNPAPTPPTTPPQGGFTGTVGAAVAPQPATPPSPPPPVAQPAAPQAPSQPPTPPPSASNPAVSESHGADDFAMPRERVVQPPGQNEPTPAPPQQQPPAQPPANPAPPAPSPAAGTTPDLEAARKAVEQAHQANQNNQNNQQNQPPPQQG